VVSNGCILEDIRARLNSRISLDLSIYTIFQKDFRMEQLQPSVEEQIQAFETLAGAIEHGEIDPALAITIDAMKSSPAGPFRFLRSGGGVAVYHRPEREGDARIDHRGKSDGALLLRLVKQNAEGFAGLGSAPSPVEPAWRSTLTWYKPQDQLPKKPGIESYEHVDCLILYKGQLLFRPWNCEHEVFDDEEGDDHFCNAEDVTLWAACQRPPVPSISPEHATRRRPSP
jgi:hypothetical protein